MKVKLVQSVKDIVDQHIDTYGADIDYIELSTIEYIEFLEALDLVAKVILIDPITKIRKYRETRIKVLS